MSVKCYYWVYFLWNRLIYSYIIQINQLLSTNKYRKSQKKLANKMPRIPL